VPSIAGDQQTRVVIDDVEDLDVGTASEPPVGDVCLPALIRLVRSKRTIDARGRLCG
jgi:hypothetical protein